MEHINWQIGLSTIKERGKYAFNNSLFSDIEFLVIDSDGDKIKVSGNKFVLAVTSPVFAAMFYGRLAESKSPIELPDCTNEGFQELLRFAYSDEVNLAGVNLMEVIYLAVKYMIPSLADKCREYFGKKVTPQNAFRLLPEVYTMNDKRLKNVCWGVIEKGSSQAFFSSSFLDISKELLFQVLGRDSLRVKEVVLFQAADRWALKRIEEKGLKCNGDIKRDVLGEDIIKLIRFPLMSQKEFDEVVLPSGVLTTEEVSELTDNFNKIPISPTIFSNRDRLAKRRLLIPDNRFNAVLPEPVTDTGFKTCSYFKVNKPVYLHGVRVFGSLGYTYKYIGSVHKRVANKPELLKETLTQTTSETEEDKIDDFFYGNTLFFKKSVRLVPNEGYAIAITVKDPEMKPTQFIFGCNSKSVVRCEDLEVTYVVAKTELFSKPPGVAIEGGQIPLLMFGNVER